MPKRVPIKAARDVAKAHGFTHCVVHGYDGQNQHVITWGASTVAAAEAAGLGNRLKAHLGWPAHLCKAESGRTLALVKANAKLRAQVKQLRSDLQAERDAVAGALV